MKNFILLFILLVAASFILSINLFASGFFLTPVKERNFANNNNKNNHNQFQSNEIPRNYDVLNYDLDVDWVDILLSEKNEPDKRKWNGKIKIKLTPLENNFSLVELDAVELQINKIFINEIELENIPDNSSGILPITLNNPININDTITLDIHYEYNNPVNRGFCHRNTELNMSSQTEGISVASTLSQPNDARYWFPCNDRPSDKAIVSIVVKVPAGFKAASNGVLDSIVLVNSLVEGIDKVLAEIYYWHSAEPMPPYLMTIAASTYDLKSFWIKKNSTTTDSVEIQYYIWKEDWDGSVNSYNAEKSLNQTEKVMHILSDIFGDYAYSKYGVATVDYSFLNSPAVGMEHQTMTTVSRWWIRNAGFPYDAFAHELAHHWFGNLVTSETWKDIWFQEGAVSWLEAVCREKVYDFEDTKELYYNHMYLPHRQYYLSMCERDSIYFTTSMYGIDDDEIFEIYDVLVYSKASWVYHQLREMLGDDIFFPLLKKLLDEFRFSNISTEQFVNFFVENVENPLVDLEIYFTQWVYKAGHPIYSIISDCSKNATSESEYNLAVEIKQIQDDEAVPDVFVMLLELEFYRNKQKIHTANILNNEREQIFNFVFDTAIDSVSINEKKALFEIETNYHTRISDNYFSKGLKFYPNPLRNGSEIFIELDNSIVVLDNSINFGIEIFDIFGRKINSECEINIINSKLISINVDLLNNGIYFINFNKRNFNKFIICRN